MTTKTVKRTRFEPNPDWPPAAQAVSLGMAILVAAKTASFAELEAIPYTIDVTGDQLELLNAHRVLLEQVRVKTPGSAGTVYVVLCDTCGRWSLTGASTAPKSCPVTTACPGTGLRVTKAPKAVA